MSGPVGIAIVYTPWLRDSRDLAIKLSNKLMERSSAVNVWSLLEIEELTTRLESCSLAITVGGDGTILRVVRIAAPRGVPILGVNLGRVGFMTELSPSDALERINQYVGEGSWVEDRAMLSVRLTGENDNEELEGPDALVTYGLNDAVIGRAGVARLIHVEVHIDGQYLTTYAADAVVVATATGSTGYNLSAGGPILFPESRSLVLKPVSAQLSLDAAMVLNPESVVNLKVKGSSNGLVSVDGFLDLPIDTGLGIQVKLSPYVAKFLHFGARRFPDALMRRLSPPYRGEFN